MAPPAAPAAAGGARAGARPVRAILFDAGNTLIRMDYAAIARYLAGHGVSVTPDDVQRAEWRARPRLDALVAATGVSTESVDTGVAVVRFVLEGLGVRDPAVVDATNAWRRAYNQPRGLWTVAEPAAREALALAHRAGVVAGVISNSNGTIRGILEDLGLASTLGFVLDSGEVGVEKPDPRIFRMALERAGVEAGEAAYVGDLYSVDVLGARRVGIDAVLIDPGGAWPPRDCPTAPDVLAAVRLILGPGLPPG